MHLFVRISSAFLIFWLTACTGNNAANQQTQSGEPAADTTAIASSDTVAAPPPEVASADTTLVAGKKVYNKNCLVCHQSDGGGVPGMYPPLSGSEWVTGDNKRLIGVLLNGLQGKIEVKGNTYNQVMPPHSFLSDGEIAAVLTYVRQNFDNQAPAITPAEVATLRKK